MSNITPEHSHNARPLDEQMAALTDRVDGDMAAVFEQLDEQSKMIVALKAKIQNLDDRRGWVDEIALILNWAERNHRWVWGVVAAGAVTTLLLNISQDGKEKLVERLTTVEAITALAIVATAGAKTALDKK
jgi:hypothetical protein